MIDIQPIDPIANNPEPPAPGWRKDLERAGLLRQLWRSRQWYGVDWWFVVVSGAMLLIFIFVALFPQLVAPFAPEIEVGPAFLGPRQVPVDIVIAVKSGSAVKNLLDLGGSSDVVGIIAGSEASTALRERENEINAGRSEASRPDISRYDTEDELLAALAKGEITAAIDDPKGVQPHQAENPGIGISRPAK